jgi:hypothetical protein
MLPSSLQEQQPAISQIPQPAGWGSFTLACRSVSVLRDGPLVSRALGWSEASPTFRLGVPNLPVGGFARSRPLLL